MKGIQPPSPLLASPIPCRYLKRNEIPLLFHKTERYQNFSGRRKLKDPEALTWLVFNLQRWYILGTEFGRGKISSKENNCMAIQYLKFKTVKSKYRNWWCRICDSEKKTTCYTKQPELNSIGRIIKGLQNFFQLFLWLSHIFMEFCTSGCVSVISRSSYQQKNRNQLN